MNLKKFFICAILVLAGQNMTVLGSDKPAENIATSNTDTQSDISVSALPSSPAEPLVQAQINHYNWQAHLSKAQMELAQSQATLAQAETQRAESAASYNRASEADLLARRSMKVMLKEALPHAVASAVGSALGVWLGHKLLNSYNFFDNFEFTKPTTKMSDLAGKQPREVRTLLHKLQKPESYGRVSPKISTQNCIFYGSPGTGKTERARAIAGELGIPFCETTVPDLTGKYVGHTAPRIKALFAQARSHNPKGKWNRFTRWTTSWFTKTPPPSPLSSRQPYAMIFIDEIDAMGKRDDFSSPEHRQHSPIDTILTQMSLPENKGVLVIGACNNTQLEDAFARRLPDKIKIELPDQEDLGQIFNHYAGKYNFAEEQYYDGRYIGPKVNPKTALMHQHKFSGDDVQKTIHKAGELAGFRERLITQADFDEAIEVMRQNKQANNGNNPEDRSVPEGMYA